ncbi:MAG: L,D-transpeptidase family protein, partial [Psychrobacter sp.]
MMKIKPIVTALSIAIVSASAIAATTDSTRTLPVRTADSLAKKVSLDVQENRSNSLGSGSSADSMTQLIDSKEDTESAAADNMSAVELTRKDEQADRNDDITEGQAVAAPSDISSIDSSDPLSFELPESEKRQDFSNDPTIKNIESKNGKRYTTLNLSNYAKQVNESVWSPNMKVNSAMTIKMQALLDWNHASPGPIDGGWGMNSKKALTNFQKMKG